MPTWHSPPFSVIEGSNLVTTNRPRPNGRAFWRLRLLPAAERSEITLLAIPSDRAPHPFAEIDGGRIVQKVARLLDGEGSVVLEESDPPPVQRRLDFQRHTDRLADGRTGIKQARSAERSIGKGCDRPGRSRWSPNHKKKKKT